MCRQIDIANEQKRDYNCLRRRVHFCVTKLEKLVYAKLESEFESEEEEEEGNEKQGGAEEENDEKEQNEEEEVVDLEVVVIRM